MYLKRINLDKTYNTRDLGGYVGINDEPTRFGRFLRSDYVGACTVEDINRLKDYGLKTVIDLRAGDELSEQPNVFDNVYGIKYFHLPIDIEPGVEVNTTGDLNLEQIYIKYLQNVTRIVHVLETIAANCSDGCILYHCAAGKDRTGLISMLLLMVAGVEISDIMADYQVTSTYIQPMLAIFKEKFPDIPQHLMESAPEWIEAANKYIIANYGNVDDYLLHIGVSIIEIQAIRNALITG